MQLSAAHLKLAQADALQPCRAKGQSSPFGMSAVLKRIWQGKHLTICPPASPSHDLPMHFEIVTIDCCISCAFVFSRQLSVVRLVQITLSVTSVHFEMPCRTLAMHLACYSHLPGNISVSDKRSLIP